MTVPEADSIAELIADCQSIPERLRTPHAAIPLPTRPSGTTAEWTVSEACLDQVQGIEDYSFS